MALWHGVANAIQNWRQVSWASLYKSIDCLLICFSMFQLLAIGPFIAFSWCGQVNLVLKALKFSWKSIGHGFLHMLKVKQRLRCTDSYVSAANHPSACCSCHHLCLLCDLQRLACGLGGSCGRCWQNLDAKMNSLASGSDCTFQSPWLPPHVSHTSWSADFDMVSNG